MPNKNLLIASGVLLGFILFLVVVNNFVVDKVAERVIQELKRSYTPGPYDPGFDPDKVNPNYFRDPELSKIQVPVWKND